MAEVPLSLKTFTDTLITFPSFRQKAKGKTEYHEKNAVNKQKEDWNSQNVKSLDRRIYIKLPWKDAHIGHIMGEVRVLMFSPIVFANCKRYHLSGHSGAFG